MMKSNRNKQFYIAKNIMDSVFIKNQPIDYDKWVDFIERNNEDFIWRENTEDGKKSLSNINNVPDDFKDRVLASLNKVCCFKEFDNKKDAYNVSISFSKDNNWISIQFIRTPKLVDLKVFLAMAKHLDAFLLKNGREIIDERVIEGL